jgi:hypothetical protein
MAQQNIFPESTEVIFSLNDDEAAAFKRFVEKCEHTHLLDWPTDLDKNETRAGINDASTLLYVIRLQTLL